MSNVDFRLRSVLFAPANQPDLLEKMPRSAPDGVIFDLEDAVPPTDKLDARVHARRLATRLREDHPNLLIFVRVNAVDSQWFDDDVRDALSPDLSGVAVPKLETIDQLDQVTSALEAAGLGHLPVLAGIESAAGVAHVEELLRAPVALAYFGAEDFIADMGGIRTPAGQEVLYARSRFVLAARLAGVYPLDQIVTQFQSDDRFLEDARSGRALGYLGKLCIHPRQVALAHEVFSPAPTEVDFAQRLLRAFHEKQSEGHGAFAFEGQMVDEPVVRRARAVLLAAGIDPNVS